MPRVKVVMRICAQTSARRSRTLRVQARTESRKDGVEMLSTWSTEATIVADRTGS